MKNFVQDGETLRLTAPSGDVVSGQAYLIGALVVVAQHDAAEGDPFSAFVGPGVISHAKAPSEAWSEGDPIYFDEGDGVFTTDSGEGGNPLAGVAVEAVADGAEDTIGKVRLDGVAR